jgi:hypothetical protein
MATHYRFSFWKRLSYFGFFFPCFSSSFCKLETFVWKAFAGVVLLDWIILSYILVHVECSRGSLTILVLLSFLNLSDLPKVFLLFRQSRFVSFVSFFFLSTFHHSTVLTGQYSPQDSFRSLPSVLSIIVFQQLSGLFDSIPLSQGCRPAVVLLFH